MACPLCFLCSRFVLIAILLKMTVRSVSRPMEPMRLQKHTQRATPRQRAMFRQMLLPHAEVGQCTPGGMGLCGGLPVWGW